MQIIKKSESIKHQNSKLCDAFEYPTKDKSISGALIELRGRYPSEGFVVNEECKEMGYVIKGSGRLIVEDKEVDLSEGDLVLIDSGEKYFWDGDMTLFMPCAPAWYPKQHKQTK